MSNENNKELHESMFVISKTQDLMNLTAQELSLTAFKIIDIYLAHINPLGIKTIQNDFVEEIEDLRVKVNDADLFKSMVNAKTIERDQKIKSWATVTISKSVYCQLMNLEKRNVKKVDLIRNLNRILEIRTHYQNADMTTAANFFTEASFDSKTGQIRMVCNYTNDQVRSIFFDTGDFKYFQYKLKVSMALKTLPAYKIAMVILNKRPFWDPKRAKNWTFDITVAELRSQMGYEDKYTDWSNFSKKILNAAKREINENVDLSFEYAVIERHGHSPAMLRFTCALGPNTCAKIKTASVSTKKKKPSFPSYADTDPRVLMVNRYFNARAGELIGMDVNLDEEAKRILDWLSTTNPATGENYTVNELKAAIDFKRNECDKSFDYQYLHPKFIFNSRNFQRYAALGTKEIEQYMPFDIIAKQAKISFEFLAYWKRQKRPLDKLLIIEALGTEKSVDVEFAVDHFTDQELDLYIQTIEAGLVDDCVQFCNAEGDAAMKRKYPSLFTSDSHTLYEDLFERTNNIFAQYQKEFDAYNDDYDENSVYCEQGKWISQINTLSCK